MTGYDEPGPLTAWALQFR